MAARAASPRGRVSRAARSAASRGGPAPDLGRSPGVDGGLLTKTVGAQTTACQYDVLGSLVAVTLPDGTQNDYLIDGQGRRIGKKRDGTLAQGFLYADGLKPTAERDGSNAAVSRFVYAGGVNVPEYMIKGGATYRILTEGAFCRRFHGARHAPHLPRDCLSSSSASAASRSRISQPCAPGPSPTGATTAAGPGPRHPRSGCSVWRHRVVARRSRPGHPVQSESLAAGLGPGPPLSGLRAVR